MSLTKHERDKQKLVQDKCQQILTELLRDEDNKYCVDCDSKGPRWASWNLGIFLCIRCAGIHRNLGVHISKVKSVNLDSWTPEQVGSIQNMGNSKARAVYEANMPDNLSRPQTDSALETFIRAKYEHKKYIAKEWVETTPKPAFDVETELKKEKDKKKNKISKSISPIGAQTDTGIQSNPIPRPNAGTSVNGKSEKVIQSQSIAQPKVDSNSASTDLLGLDLMSSANDEPFGFFTSADSNNKKETEATTQPKDSKTLEDEEKDFFSQKAPEKSEEKKLTKESILSLYSKAPPSNALNGFMAQPVNPMNQFPGANMPFGASNAPKPANAMMSSTNPFLANTNANSAFMSSDFSQQQLLQGLSSMQLNPNPISQIPLSNPAPANTQGHLNWFSPGPVGPSAATNSMPAGQQSSLVNPFVDSNSSFNAFSSGNILNFDLKPNGSSTGFNSANPPATAPNPLLTINTQKDSGSNLNSFW